MRRLNRLLAALPLLALVVVAFSYLPAQAQTKEMNSYPNGRLSQVEPLTRSYSGTTAHEVQDFLNQKTEEEEQERAAREKQLRAFGNYGNLPEKVGESYFGRLYPKPPYYQYER
jgi:hypothetical protein